MPCIVSDHVGAKDFIENGKTGFIFKACDDASLIDILRSIIDNKEALENINASIMKEEIDLRFEYHCKYIEKSYGNMYARVLIN